MVKTGSIATKVALVVSAVVVAALALVGVFALRSSDAELVRLQLDQASRRLNTNLAIADRKSTRLNSSHTMTSRMPSSA